MSPSIRRRRVWLRAALLTVLALLAGGCRLRLDVTVDVNRDGGGTLAVAVGADAELLALAEEAGADPLGGLAEVAGPLRDEGWRVSDGADGDGGRTVTLRRPFTDPDEFNTAAGQLAQALAAEEVVLLEPLRLAVTDDRVTLDGGAGAEPTAAVRDYGLSPRAAVRRVAAQDALDYTVTVVMPGEILSTSAGVPEGPRLTWQVEPGASVDIQAESTRPGAPWVRGALGAAGGALVAGGALWLWSRRRRGPAPA